MSIEIPDAAIEAAAKRMYGPSDWNDDDRLERTFYRNSAAAILEAALPHLIPAITADLRAQLRCKFIEMDGRLFDVEEPDKTGAIAIRPMVGVQCRRSKKLLTDSPEWRARMPLSDEQLKRLCLVAAKADLAEIGHYASDEAESIWGTYVPIVPAVAEAAVTDVLDRIDDAMDELSYAARWEHKDERAVEIWVDAINLVRSFYPAPTAAEEGADTDGSK